VKQPYKQSRSEVYVKVDKNIEIHLIHRQGVFDVQKAFYGWNSIVKYHQ
jgi:hypothetical protein